MNARAARSKPDAPEIGHDLGFRPLYRQVRDTLVHRLVCGTWAPGSAIPSEMQLAAALGVSQGTVRKALDAMTAENLLVRRQGRGTFVAEHDEARILFQFFKLTPDAGEPDFPESRVISVAQRAAHPGERKALALADDERIVRIRRVRSLRGLPVIAETIVLPLRLVPDLADDAIPNNLYGLYATRYGITIGRAREKLKAVALGRRDARLLRAAAGTPALLIDRTALSLEGTPVELRISVCLTRNHHYLSELR